MRQHRLPAIAARLRLNRGFDSAWYSDTHYAELLQKDWVLTRQAWSLITQASRSEPRQSLTLAQQLQKLQALREARAAGKTEAEAQQAAAAALAASSVQAQGMAGCDYPNHRVARIFTQQLPYKSVVSTFAYAVPSSGPQKKYGLFPKTTPGGPGGQAGGPGAARQQQQQQQGRGGGQRPPAGPRGRGQG